MRTRTSDFCDREGNFTYSLEVQHPESRKWLYLKSDEGLVDFKTEAERDSFRRKVARARDFKGVKDIWDAWDPGASAVVEGEK